ncbi:MAG: DUF624 domain-containing protein [Oscillospiraceae bacterium]|nr:DUF624 domain-containing protein [Oscillospiraceae bacterium]
MERRDIQSTPLARFLRCLCDLMVVNWLWIICSLPIITIGPATCALFTVTLKLAKDEPLRLLKTFFEAFRENFKQGLVLGLIAVGLFIVGVTDFLFALEQVGLFRNLFLVVAAIVICLLLIFISYAFALQARFENNLKGHIKNAFLLAVCSPGWTVLMGAVYVLPIAGILFWPELFVQVLGFVYIMMAVSGPAFLGSFILKHIFARFGDEEALPPDEEEFMEE